MARKWWTLIAVSVATFMLLLDITVVNVALPSIRKDLGASFADLQWVVDAYALTLAALVLTAGSLADRLGRRRLFAAGLAIFSVASLLCALAPDPTLLNLARALQGVGGAVMFAVSLALVAQEFPAGRERGTAMGLYGATIGVAVAIGPLVGGALTDGLGWRSIFYLNVPIGVAALAITYLKLRESRDPNATRVDWAGVATLQRRAVPARAGAGARQRRGLGQHRDRLAARRLRGPARRVHRGRAPGQRADAAARPLQAAVVHRGAAGGVRGLGLGLRALPLHHASTSRTTSATRRSRRGCATCRSRWRASSSRRSPAPCCPAPPHVLLMSAGLGLAGVGLLLMSGVGATSEWTTLLGGFLVLGVGVGLLNPVIADVALSVVPKERSGMAAGINDTFRQVGVAVGVAVWGAIFVGRGAAKVSELVAGTPAASGARPRQLVEAASSGSLHQALAAVPPQLHHQVSNAAHQGFLAGFNDVLTLGALLCLAGAVLALWLVREREIEREPMEPAGELEADALRQPAVA